MVVKVSVLVFLVVTSSGLTDECSQVSAISPDINSTSFYH
jgi:hypothetical protein